MIAHSTIAGIIDQIPEATSVFERYHIDYWQNSQLTLSELCQEDALRLFNLVREIHQLQIHRPAGKQMVKWSEMSLKELCRYIVDHHHSYIKSALPALVVHGFQVARQVGDDMPQLEEVKRVLTKIRAEFTHHMMKEEDILFPRIVQLEEIVSTGATPGMKIRMIVDPLKSVIKDHSHADLWFADIRKLTDNFRCPPFADNLFQQFYQELRDFEADLHLHIYLENEVLFPEVHQLIVKQGY